MNLLLSPEDEDLRSWIAPASNLSHVRVWCAPVGVHHARNRGEFLHRVVMHRILLVLLPPKEIAVVDHINNNPLDNRRENLQLLTQRQNSLRTTRGKGENKYLRVYKHRRRFQVKITVDRARNTFGSYASIGEAAFWADVWAYRILPQEAQLNFPERIDEIRREAMKLDCPGWSWQREHQS